MSLCTTSTTTRKPTCGPLTISLFFERQWRRLEPPFGTMNALDCSRIIDNFGLSILRYHTKDYDTADYAYKPIKCWFMHTYRGRNNGHDRCWIRQFGWRVEWPRTHYFVQWKSSSFSWPLRLLIYVFTSLVRFVGLYLWGSPTAVFRIFRVATHCSRTVDQNEW